MSFYLFKGTKDQEKIGDAIIETDEISAILANKRIMKDSVDFLVKLDMKSNESYISNYNTEEEARIAIAEISGSNKIANEMIFLVRDDKLKEETLESLNMLRKLMR